MKFNLKGLITESYEFKFDPTIPIEVLKDEHRPIWYLKRNPLELGSYVEVSDVCSEDELKKKILEEIRRDLERAYEIYVVKGLEKEPKRFKRYKKRLESIITAKPLKDAEKSY